MIWSDTTLYGLLYLQEVQQFLHNLTLILDEKWIILPFGAILPVCGRITFHRLDCGIFLLVFVFKKSPSCSNSLREIFVRLFDHLLIILALLCYFISMIENSGFKKNRSVRSFACSFVHSRSKSALDRDCVFHVVVLVRFIFSGLIGRYPAALNNATGFFFITIIIRSVKTTLTWRK